jgi:uncharacterized spore protein YtfJ
MELRIQDIIDQAGDAISARGVFGEPVQHEGITVIPVATVRGGAGGGGGRGRNNGEEGGGGGFGVTARPVGAFVIRGHDVEWRPAIDSGRLALAGILVAGLAILTARTAIKARAKTRRKIGA